MRKILLLFVLISICNVIVGQNLPMSKYKYINQSYNDTIDGYGYIRFGIDQQTKDTIKYFSQTNKFQIITTEGVLITDGQLTNCGCETSANGFWMEKYRNGNLKEHGNYYCNEKTGTWVYFYDNGNIKKVETLKRPYDIILSEDRLPINFKIGKTTLINELLRSGYYKEFYRNGNIKVEGQYEIFEKHETVDTIITFDPETYEETLHLFEGDFWKPISLKTGSWNYYRKDGQLESSETIYHSTENKNFRLIERRYQELFNVGKK